jgi:hypothetical protein
MEKTSFLRDYEIVTQNNECPQSFHHFSALVALSSIVSGRVWLDLGLFTIRPNLYVILTGTPGVKKTTAMSVTKRLLRELGDAVPLSAECQTKEALVQSMASNARTCDVGKGDVPRNFVPLDAECSKFVYTPMTVCVTELSQFVGSGNAAHMLDFLTTIYDEEVFINATKGRGTDHLPMPYLTLLGCTVPDWITARLKDDVITGGFSRRAIFVYEHATTQRIAIPTVTPEMEAAWLRVVAKAKRLLKLKGPYQWGVGAKEFYVKWYEGLKRPEDPLLEGWYNSVHIQMFKIAMLIAASEWESGQPVLEIVHMQISMELLKTVESNIPKVFKGVGRNELAGISNKLLELLNTGIEKKLPLRIVRRELFRDADIQEINRIIAHLKSTKQIVEVQAKNPLNDIVEPFLKLVPK